MAHYNRTGRSIDLPGGAKDLGQVLERKERARRRLLLLQFGIVEPPLTRRLFIGAQVTIPELCSITSRSVTSIVLDLLKLGHIATAGTVLSFKTAAQVLGLYGISAEKPHRENTRTIEE